MKRLFSILILLPILLSSCTKTFFVFAKVIGIDSNTSNLELEFTFKDKSLQEDVNISTIKILRNDSILYELENTSESNHVSKWHFPNVPKGFKITYPINAQTILPFDQSNELDFWFNGYWKNTGGTSQWLFKPSHLKTANRWLFDDDGNKIINIESCYESWIGKDIIKIYANVNLDIHSETINLMNSKKEKINFEVKSKKDNENIVFLTLEEKVKKGEILTLTFVTKNGNTFSDTITIDGHSSIGIIGKYK